MLKFGTHFGRFQDLKKYIGILDLWGDFKPLILWGDLTYEAIWALWGDFKTIEDTMFDMFYIVFLAIYGLGGSFNRRQGKRTNSCV